MVIETANRNSGVEFRLVKDKINRPIHQWALFGPELDQPERQCLELLLRLFEEERAEPTADDGLLLSHPQIASLTGKELKRLSLPEPSPYLLTIEASEAISSQDFQFRFHLETPTGRPLVGSQRTGSLLQVGSSSYTLVEPFYSLLEALESFNSAPPSDLQERLLEWAKIRELLPEKSTLDDYLAETRIQRAGQFTLKPRVGAQGEIDFDPELLHHAGTALPLTVVGDSDLELQLDEEPPFLPPASQEQFQAQFRNRSTVQPKYAVGGGLHVVLDEPLREALEVVHAKQRAPQAERGQFLANPYADLREALPHLDDELVETLFYEPPDYGDRVEGIGIWTRKILPFLKPATEPWLPPEGGGLIIAGERIELTHDEAIQLLEQVESAVETGIAVVDHGDVSIPATPETIEALNHLIPRLQPEPEEASEDLTGHETEPSTVDADHRPALLIVDNLEEGLFLREQSSRPGDLGSPSGLLPQTRLLPHQELGLKWLQHHWRTGSAGCLLADDMGLGKTLEALAFLTWYCELSGTSPDLEDKPILIVAPTGLLMNWEAEAEKFLKPDCLGTLLRAFRQDLRELRQPGAPPKGKEIDFSAGAAILDVEALSESGWVLATYETVRDYQFSFGQIDWGVVVFDEIQKIKNPTAMLTSAAKALSADFVLGLTGTPVENRSADLWCVVDTCQPGQLGTLRDFLREWESAEEERLGELRDRLLQPQSGTPPAILRRLKEDHLDGLPAKSVRYLDKPMPPVQARAYSQSVEEARQSRDGKGAVLKALHQLRSISLHPGSSTGEVIGDDEFISHSARLIGLVEILDSVKEQRQKALIYLESLDMQVRLAGVLQRRYQLESLPLSISGRVRGDLRKGRADEFQSKRGFNVMLLSPRAGGVGLTITEANHVIHLSRWWNPAVEDQCTDRVYRIGQTRPVQVSYPRALHPTWGEYSFDARLDQLISKKRELFHNLMMPPAATMDEVNRLFEETTQEVPVT